MEERTAAEVAQIFNAAGDSVTLINGGNPAWETEDEWKETAQRNLEPLEIIICTTEDFTAIDKAIVDGKKIYS